METRIKELKVSSFRGIKDLYLSNCNDINVIVGDNNSGKTSLLEAIMLLKNKSISNVINSCCRRNIFRSVSSMYTEFVYAFPCGTDNKEISLESVLGSGKKYNYAIKGKVNKAILGVSDLQEVKKFVGAAYQNYLREVSQFNGTIQIDVDDVNLYKNGFHLNMFDGLRTKILQEKPEFLKVVYLSPVDYATPNNVYRPILSDLKYKELVIEVLKTFDKNITDILLVPDEFDIPSLNIVSSKIGMVPISIYGDGIKKALLIASGIAAANNGVLLIDEFETAIHKKNYEDIFAFVGKAAKQFNVQIFLTTHSLEAVDELLNLDSTVNNDGINFITLRKDEEAGRTINRTMLARDVKSNREKFDFEVRL